jgi:hypothetical protein
VFVSQSLRIYLQEDGGGVFVVGGLRARVSHVGQSVRLEAARGQDPILSPRSVGRAAGPSKNSERGHKRRYNMNK